MRGGADWELWAAEAAAMGGLWEVLRRVEAATDRIWCLPVLAGGNTDAGLEMMADHVGRAAGHSARGQLLGAGLNLGRACAAAEFVCAAASGGLAAWALDVKEFLECLPAVTDGAPAGIRVPEGVPGPAEWLDDLEARASEISNGDHDGGDP